MVQKILWPEIGVEQGRGHATEKLENFENDGFSKIFEFKCRSVGYERWLVGTVETDNKVAV